VNVGGTSIRNIVNRLQIHAESEPIGTKQHCVQTISLHYVRMKKIDHRSMPGKPLYQHKRLCSQTHASHTEFKHNIDNRNRTDTSSLGKGEGMESSVSWCSVGQFRCWGNPELRNVLVRSAYMRRAFRFLLPVPTSNGRARCRVRTSRNVPAYVLIHYRNWATVKSTTATARPLIASLVAGRREELAFHHDVQRPKPRILVSMINRHFPFTPQVYTPPPLFGSHSNS
jgi:hypothetical protein